MRVLHINTNAYFGGAAIAARRHCEAMRKQGIDAMMLSLEGEEDEMTKIFATKQPSYIHRKLKWIFHRIRSKILFRSPWHFVEKDYDICNLNIVREADIIYLHWVNDFIGYKAVENLLKTGKPIVWFLHDMWPITGGCHHSFECRNYEKDCRKCPMMKFFKNLPSIQLKKKCESWKCYPNLILAAPSTWLTDCIKLSNLFKGHKCFTVRNVIDTDLFRPMNKRNVRTELKLPIDKKLIIFSSMGINNLYKGTQFLVEALNRIACDNYEYLVVGECKTDIFPANIKVKMHITGFVCSTEKMVKLYNAADILLITSLADNFPNVVLEAMACGIPAVGFATGGIKDQIIHKHNGWIVKPKDVEGMVKGINWIFKEANYSFLSKNARVFAEEECSYHNVIKVHEQLLKYAKNT